MLGFVQSWFTPGANPIGIDFGGDSLRMAQVEAGGGPDGPADHRLVAAAQADVPVHLRHDPAARAAFFSETVRDLWSRGNFRGRRAVLGLPAAWMNIQHLRLPRMDDDALKKALSWEARGKLPYDPSQAVLRHIVAGEIHQDGEQRYEVILLAAARDAVNQLLNAAARARLDVVGMNVEPKAVIDCFSHVYRRKSDSEQTNLFVDIGCGATRAFIARGRQVLFARVIPIAGDHLTRAVAEATHCSFDEARALRIALSAAATPASPPPPIGNNVADARLSGDLRSCRMEPIEAACPEAAMVAPAPGVAKQVSEACQATVQRLVEELDLCRRYHEATFSSLPVDRLIFIGGEARHRSLCQEIARGLNLAAQLGDPMARMARTCEIGPESGIDRRLPQPAWSVALGLSMGPVTSDVAETAAAKE